MRTKMYHYESFIIFYKNNDVGIAYDEEIKEDPLIKEL
jgi:hypothetical protein